MANIYMKRCSSLPIKQMQIKTTVRYYFTPNKTVITKPADHNKFCEDVEKSSQIGTLIHFWWEY